MSVIELSWTAKKGRSFISVVDSANQTILCWRLYLYIWLLCNCICVFQWILYFKAATSTISGAGVVVIAFFRHIVIVFVLRVYFCISMGAGIVFWSSGLVCNILARDGLVVVVAPARRDLSGRRPADRAPVRSAFSWISFFWISLWFFFRFLLIFLWISFF